MSATTKTAAPDLLPCPFCGGDTEVDGKSESVRVRCLRCGAIGPVSYFDPDDETQIEEAEHNSRAGWNARAALEAPAAASGAGAPNVVAWLHQDGASCLTDHQKREGT